MVTTPSGWDFLREQRHAVGLTKADVARAVGVSQRLVDYWERGLRQPQIDHVRALAHALRLDPQEVLSGILDHWAPEK